MATAWRKLESSDLLDSFTAAAFSPDSSTIAVLSDLGEFGLFNVESGELVAKGKAGNDGGQLAFIGAGEQLLAGTKTLNTFDAATLKKKPKELALKGHKAPPNAIAFSPDGTKIATAGGDFCNTNDRFLRLWDAASGAELTRVKLAKKATGVLDVVWAADGSWLATGSEDQQLRVLSVPDLAEQRSVVLGEPQEHGGGVTRVRISADGDSLAAATSEGWLFLLDVADADAPPRRLERVREGIDEQRPRESITVEAMCFSPDDRQIVVTRAVAYEDGYADALLCLDRASGAVTRSLPAPRADNRRLAFSADGRWMLAAGHDGLFVWPAAAVIG
jgi:WD40 repeat protein